MHPIITLCSLFHYEKESRKCALSSIKTGHRQVSCHSFEPDGEQSPPRTNPIPWCKPVKMLFHRCKTFLEFPNSGLLQSYSTCHFNSRIFKRWLRLVKSHRRTSSEILPLLLGQPCAWFVWFLNRCYWICWRPSKIAFNIYNNINS